MGELRKFYSLADVVFVGRSIADMGGSDTMEVAALAKPIIVGPHNENFADRSISSNCSEAIRIVPAEWMTPRRPNTGRSRAELLETRPRPRHWRQRRKSSSRTAAHRANARETNGDHGEPAVQA